MSDKNHQNLPSSRREGFIVNLINDEIMVKWSEFNNSTGKIKAAFEKHFPKSLFVRILRVGPAVKDQKIVPGNIAIISMGVGHKLDAYSFFEDCDHMIVHEANILYQADLD